MTKVWVGLVSLLVAAASLAATVNAAPARLKWKRPAVTVAISSSLLAETPNVPSRGEALDAIEKSLKTWSAAANVTLRPVTSQLQNVDPAGQQGDGVSLLTIAATPENVALFPKGGEDAAARTRIFFDARGFITEADIVLNPFIQFSNGGLPGTFDLQGTVTHELGHLLGLPHSDVIGSTMSEINSQNGIFNVTGFASRTLSGSDVAAIRALYGPPPNDAECCGRISGRLTLSPARPAAGWSVWAEDVLTGAVVASSRTGSDGSYTLAGLDYGSVRVLAQPAAGTRASVAAESLGEAQISRSEPNGTLNKVVAQRTLGFELSLIGFDQQLANAAVMLNGGLRYRLLVAGRGLHPDTIRLGTDSPWLTITRSAESRIDFGKGLSVLEFSVSVDPAAPSGSYSLYAASASTGLSRYLIGGLTVERFPNLLAEGTVGE